MAAFFSDRFWGGRIAGGVVTASRRVRAQLTLSTSAEKLPLKKQLYNLGSSSTVAGLCRRRDQSHSANRSLAHRHHHHYHRHHTSHSTGHRMNWSRFETGSAGSGRLFSRRTVVRLNQQQRHKTSVHRCTQLNSSSSTSGHHRLKDIKSTSSSSSSINCRLLMERCVAHHHAVHGDVKEPTKRNDTNLVISFCCATVNVEDF